MGGSILVVDDDSDIQLALKEILEDEGFAVALAGNGKEALEQLREFVPSLILLDFRMPVMNGARFRQLQLEDEVLARIPTVLITADARSEEVAREMHVNAVMAKPIALSDLLEVARYYCAAS